MYRVCSTLLVKSQRHVNFRRMSSQTPRSGDTAERRLQMQLEHDMTIKRLEFDHKPMELTQRQLEIQQKRGLEYLGVSRDTANLLTVGGTTVLVVSSGAWFVSQLLADKKANITFLRREFTLQSENMQRELTHQSENMRSFISGGHYPKEATPQKPASEKQS